MKQDYMTLHTHLLTAKDRQDPTQPKRIPLGPKLDTLLQKADQNLNIRRACQPTMLKTKSSQTTHPDPVQDSRGVLK